VKIPEKYKSKIYYLEMENSYFDSNNHEIDLANYIIQKLSEKNERF